MTGSLLPKLREQFAEFLQDTSLKRLGLLDLPTCVGFGYDHYRKTEDGRRRTENLSPPAEPYLLVPVIIQKDDAIFSNNHRLASYFLEPLDCTYQSDKKVQSFRSVTGQRSRNINRVPIDYASRPRLRNRLTLP
jgi:hypothetical protein